MHGSLGTEETSAYIGVETGGGLTPLAVEVLRRRFDSADPVAEWRPPRPDWRSGLPGLEVLEAELSRLSSSRGRVVLYGHDDMDGMTGLFIGCRVLSLHGFEVAPVVPDRSSDDYGLLPSRMDSLLRPGDLLLTVDNGCSSVEGVEWALERGARVVITDHHTLNPPLPRAHALIDPQSVGWPATVLAGCGVLHAALSCIFPDCEDDPSLIAAAVLGTVSDRVPLLAWNRHLLSRFDSLGDEGLTEGLKVILGAWPGRGSQWCASQVRQQITSTVGKGLESGMSRLLELMESDDRRASLAQWQEMTVRAEARSRVLAELLGRAIAGRDPEGDALGMVLVNLGDIPPGMGGTLASKLSRIFRRTAIVVTRREDGVLLGEARSPGDWNVAAFLVGMKGVFESAGGHERAAGFSAVGLSWEALRDRLLAHADTHPASRVPDPHVDLELDTLPPASDLACLAPFGPGFPPPAVRVNSLRHLLQVGPGGPGWCISEDSGE